MKKLAIIAITILSIANAQADAYDDPNFDERKVVGENEESIWVPTEVGKGKILHLEALHSEHLGVYPFAWDGTGIEPKGVNYYHYFDNPKYTCRYDIGYPCKEDTLEDTTKVKVNVVPEPVPLVLFGISLLIWCIFGIWGRRR